MKTLASRVLMPLFVLCLATGLVACSSSKPDTTGYKSDGFPAPAQELVYQAAADTLAQQGYVIDHSNSSVERGVLQTRWDTHFAPFSGKGYRERATVKIVPVAGADQYYRTETNVIRQINKNLVEPSNPVAADWSDAERMRDVENMLSRRIESSFLPLSVSPEFAKRNHLPSRGPGRMTFPEERAAEAEAARKRASEGTFLGMGGGGDPDLPKFP